MWQAFFVTVLRDNDQRIDGLALEVRIIGEQATIKLSSAFNLNDPYELKFNLDIDPLADGHEQEYYRNNPSRTVQDFENWKKHALEYDGYTWYTEQQQRNAVAQTIALCSFTEKNDNNLMWSHYTNNHRGICVEYKPELFEYLKTLKDFLAFWKVNYSDEPPIVKGLEDVNSKVEKIMFNKQSEWQYENEHRIVFLSDKDTDFIPIDRKFIKSVYIGSRADKEIDSKILSISNNTEIEVYYGVTLGKSYKVDFKKHKNGTIYSRAFWR
ncbi:MAG: DUF2971 domain-containing protein [Flavobacterium sp.]|nr:MAG: DUF2971 domain-containing protein [Flavobacterium sp.]